MFWCGNQKSLFVRWCQRSSFLALRSETRRRLPVLLVQVPAQLLPADEPSQHFHSLCRCYLANGCACAGPIISATLCPVTTLCLFLHTDALAANSSLPAAGSSLAAQRLGGGGALTAPGALALNGSALDQYQQQQGVKTLPAVSMWSMLTAPLSSCSQAVITLSLLIGFICGMCNIGMPWLMLLSSIGLPCICYGNSSS